MKKDTAFVICSRIDSERVPGKVFKKINGIPLIEHLIMRLQKTGLDIIIAVPDIQYDQYKYLEAYYGVYIFSSEHEFDPLARMAEVASKCGLNQVIRVTHDKIFVDENDVFKALDTYHRRNLDYLYGSTFIPGSGFEIISLKALWDAATNYQNIEHISYAIRMITSNKFDYKSIHSDQEIRLLLDFHDDFKLLEVIFSQLGNECTLEDVCRYLRKNKDLLQINRSPKVTLYTCAFNAEKFLEKAMSSVARQVGFKNFEYILVDDHSRDKTCELMARFCLEHSNAKWIRNEKNLGLASSSNVAIKHARGDYVMRLDADDYFSSNHSVEAMIKEIEDTKNEIIYPNFYDGSLDVIGSGKLNHHPACAIFDKRALNHIKFTDGLRGYDGLDLFTRARDQLKIGYLNKPIFFYFHRGDSLSRTDLEERSKIKSKILGEKCEEKVQSI